MLSAMVMQWMMLCANCANWGVPFLGAGQVRLPVIVDVCVVRGRGGRRWGRGPGEKAPEAAPVPARGTHGDLAPGAAPRLASTPTAAALKGQQESHRVIASTIVTIV